MQDGHRGVVVCFVELGEQDVLDLADELLDVRVKLLHELCLAVVHENVSVALVCLQHVPKQSRNIAALVLVGIE